MRVAVVNALAFVLLAPRGSRTGRASSCRPERRGLGVIEVDRLGRNVTMRARGLAIACIVASGALVATGLTADVVHLSSGGQITVERWRDLGDVIEVEVGGGLLRIPKPEIVRIETTGESGPPGAARPAPVPTPAPPPAVPGPPTAASAALPGARDPQVARALANLRHADVTVRRQAAAELVVHGALQRGGNDLVPPLLQAVRDPDAQVRVTAASTVAEFRSHADQVVPVLLRGLRERDPQLRYRAVVGLAAYGPRVHGVLPALVQAATDPDLLIQILARGFVVEIGQALSSADTEAVPGLVTLLHDQRADFRRFSAKALGRIGPGARDAVSALVAALTDPDQGVRVEAAPLEPEAGALLLRALEAARDEWLVRAIRFHVGSSS